MIPQRFPRYLKNHFMLWTLARIPTYRCLKRLNSSGTYRRCFEKAFCIWRGVKESVSLAIHAYLETFFSINPYYRISPANWLNFFDHIAVSYFLLLGFQIKLLSFCAISRPRFSTLDLDISCNPRSERVREILVLLTLWLLICSWENNK